MQVSLREGPADKPAAAGWPQKIKRLTGGPRPRRLIPAAAAAIILMAVALILFSPMANGKIALGQVYHAIATVRNVCISRFVPGKKDPTRVEYVSKTLKSKLFVLEDRIALRDLENMVIKTKIRATGEITTMPIPPERLIEFTEALEATFGLVPFPDITDVPEDAQWTRVPEDRVEDIIPGTVVYDLIWSDQAGEATRHYKWRAFIDPDTVLPQRTEYTRTIAGLPSSAWKRVYVVRYPSDSDIEAVIRGAFE
jgi:hypothetical protein